MKEVKDVKLLEIFLPPVASQMGKHFFNNPYGDYAVRCGHCHLWFVWDGKLKKWVKR